MTKRFVLRARRLFESGLNLMQSKVFNPRLGLLP